VTQNVPRPDRVDTGASPLSRGTGVPQALNAAVKALVFALLLVAGTGLGATRAQQLNNCSTCTEASGCDEANTSCVAECRARLFTIDPRRSNCISTCSGIASACTKSVQSFCQAGNRCR
jgi:hypothetical protein